MITAAPVKTLAAPRRLRCGARLVGHRGSRLACLRGTAWITLDGERRDIVLGPGEAFVIDSDRPLLVQSLHAGAAIELSVTEPAPPSRPRVPGFWQGLRARLGAPAPRLGAA